MGGPSLIIRAVRTPLNLMRLFFWGVFRNFILLLGPASIPWLEGAITAIYFNLMRSKREIVRRELQRSFGDWPDEKIEAAVRESFRVYIGFQVKNLFLQRLNPSNIGR